MADLHTMPIRRETESPVRLSPREAEVIELSKKLRRKDIALVLGISENTVKVHLSKAYAKLGAEGRTDAVLIWMGRAA